MHHKEIIILYFPPSYSILLSFSKTENTITHNRGFVFCLEKKRVGTWEKKGGGVVVSTQDWTPEMEIETSGVRFTNIKTLLS